MEENTKNIKKVLQEDKDLTVDVEEINRIFRIFLDRIPTEQEITRFEGIRESEWKIIESYIKEEEDRNSMDRDKSLNEERNQMDAMKIGGDLANKEMKIKGGQNLDSLKEMAATPGMAGPMAGMPSVVPPMPQRPMIDGQGGCGSKASPNTKYIQDGKNFLVRFE